MARATVEAPREFLYRLPGRPGGSRPGTHASRSSGPGSAFAARGRLFDHPDPRRLDLRASLMSVPREWRVRINQQRSGVTLQVIVDVSASMRFGADDGKLGTAIDFVRALGRSAFRSGDTVGLIAFDATVRESVSLVPRAGRGVGEAMADALDSLRDEPGRAGGGEALLAAASRASGAALIFVVSDFHFPLTAPRDERDDTAGHRRGGLVARVGEVLAPALVVPLVVRDPAEIEPPAANGWLDLIDVESGRRRPLWMRDRTRRAWRERVAAREAELDAAFAASDLRALRLLGGFDPEALTRHFIEAVA